LGSFFARVPRDVRSLAAHFSARGVRAYPVGGAVRDLLIGGKDPACLEWDLAVSCVPEKTLEIFPDAIPTGIAHGTLTVRWKGRFYEATSFRGDDSYSDGRHPGGVKFGLTLEEDLSRRDFTINAVALDLRRGAVIDPFGGRTDIGRRLIRCVGDAAVRFSEDGLRPMRAVRFASTLNFRLHPAVRRAIPETLGTFKKVSAERIRDELVKMMSAGTPSRGIDLMRRTGLLALVIPELLEGVGVGQNRWHRRDVYRHSLRTMDLTNGPPLIRLAALLHDVSKPSCIGGAGSDRTFYGHEKKGAETVERILRRLRFSRVEAQKAARLVACHMFAYTEEWKDGAVRRFVRRVGEDLVPWALELQRADIRARGTHVKRSLSAVDRIEKRLAVMAASGLTVKTSDLAVDGNDVIRILGIRPGPEVGRVLSALLEMVMDDPSLNTRKRLADLTATIGKRGTDAW
jgi:tRNA nucleotidyltransferase (CCA-adding enzyme)